MNILFSNNSSVFVVQDDDEESSAATFEKKPGYHAPVALLNDIPQSSEQVSIIDA